MNARRRMALLLLLSGGLHAAVLAGRAGAPRPALPAQPAAALAVNLFATTPGRPGADARRLAPARPRARPPRPQAPPPATRAPGTAARAVQEKPPARRQPPPDRATGSAAGAVRPDPALRTLVRGRLQRELAARFRYPYLARRHGWEGRVVLGLQLTPDGHIHRPRVTKSSGHRVLDRAALDAVAGAGPLEWAPPLLQGAALDLDLPVIYRLTGE